MANRIKFTSKLRYWFDQTMAAGTGALIGWLGIISLIIILAFGAIIALTGIAQQDGESLTFAEAAWESLMRTLDAGTDRGRHAIRPGRVDHRLDG